MVLTFRGFVQLHLMCSACTFYLLGTLPPLDSSSAPKGTLGCVWLCTPTNPKKEGLFSHFKVQIVSYSKGNSCQLIYAYALQSIYNAWTWKRLKTLADRCYLSLSHRKAHGPLLQVQMYQFEQSINVRCVSYLKVAEFGDAGNVLKHLKSRRSSWVNEQIFWTCWPVGLQTMIVEDAFLFVYLFPWWLLFYSIIVFYSILVLISLNNEILLNNSKRSVNQHLTQALA